MAFQVYQEKQHMRNSVFIYVIAGFLLLYGGIMALIFLKGDTDRNEFLIAISISLVVVFLVSWIIFTLSLEIRIDEHNVFYKMPPLINSERTIHRNEIESFEVINYKPIGQYGGWGIRWSPKYGKAYMVSGHTGLRLKLKNGKNLLLGTHKKEEIESAMNRLMKMNSENA